MHVYKQSTGEWFHDGVLAGAGYSGNGADKNVPADQDVKDHGPIPENLYTIGEAFTYPRLGPLVMSLTPDADEQMHGRDGFFLHGDSIEHPGDGSEGCIVMPNDARVQIAAWVAAGDNRLQVIA
jgi:hypothetical protein